MKVCPKCQASFAEGFVYCPNDAELLRRYDLRARLRLESAPACNFLLTTDSLPQRLREGMQGAWLELRRDPRGFCAALFYGEDNPQRRKQLLQRGAAVAVITYSLLVTMFALLGLSASTMTAQLVEARQIPASNTALVRLILPVAAKREFTKGREGHLGGSASQPLRAHGGGGGGEPEAASASPGNPPRAELLPQQRLPDPEPPKIPQPALIQVPTIVADPLVVKFTSGPTGVPNAPPAPPGKGAGLHGGLGGGDGTGVGPGRGPGFGPGENGNAGTGSFAIGGHPSTGDGNQSNAPRLATARMRPTILYREKARYSEEARQQHAQGAVVLMATFTANGQITDIRVVRGQPFGLTEEAIQAAKRIRFQPAVENGVPVTVRAQLEYNFALY
ncbi:MAG: TonB family protein [Acidobacteria bacterium]|nr:TonB family protein [Acidobacteriota bacterium]MBI3423615.1 TonB family protein [Acidobacteriota bacterium]